MTPRGISRLVAGLIVAAFWFPVCLYFRDDRYGPLGFILAASFTVPITLFVAAPLVYFLRGRLSFWLCCVLGVVLGSLGLVPNMLAGNWGAARNIGLTMMLVGLVSSMLFWVVGVWRNGDLTCASS